jgi:hypothetical protein
VSKGSRAVRLDLGGACRPATEGVPITGGVVGVRGVDAPGVLVSLGAGIAGSGGMAGGRFDLHGNVDNRVVLFKQVQPGP